MAKNSTSKVRTVRREKLQRQQGEGEDDIGSPGVLTA